MKRANLLCIVLMVFSFITISHAQDDSKHDDEAKRAKVESAKISFITEQLNLTPQQAEKFWPLYKEFNEKRKEIRKSLSTLRAETQKTSLSEDQIKDNLKAALKLRQKEVDTEKEYFEKYQKVISYRQIAELYRSEKQFAMELIRKLDGDKKNKHKEKDH